MMDNTQVIAVNRLEQVKNKVFNTIDVAEGTRREYFIRVDNFLRFTQEHGLNEGSYLDYKRFLANNDTYSVSTKNKYLISAKVFLDGLYRLRLIPYKVTDGVKGFTQSRLHKKDGLTDDDVGKLQTYFSDLLEKPVKTDPVRTTTFSTSPSSTLRGQFTSARRGFLQWSKGGNFIGISSLIQVINII